MFLKDPLYTLVTGYKLFAEFNFIRDVGVTIWRVLGGFVIAALIGVPLGIVMGAYKPVEAFFEPFVSFARYLPASAFIPLLILWAGVGETQKLAVIFIGSGVPVVQMIFGIFCIGVIGLASDLTFKWANQRLYPWAF